MTSPAHLRSARWSAARWRTRGPAAAGAPSSASSRRCWRRASRSGAEPPRRRLRMRRSPPAAPSSCAGQRPIAACSGSIHKREDETMTQNLTTPAVRTPDPSSETTTNTKTTRALLAGGVVAGPLFIVVGLVQMLTRDGFDPTRHPLSLLSLGELGWIQLANFVVAGLLFVASAVGMRRVLHPGRGATWGPRLIGVYGAGLIMGGVFVADPALGFPPGTPEGIPDQFSWHGAVHAVAPVLASLALVAACVVFARRFAALRQRGW